MSDSVIISVPVSSLTNLDSKATNVDTVDSSKKDAAVSPKTLSDKEKLELRAKKFGSQVDSTKLESRAKRFGETATPAAANGTDDEKLKKRSERFGNSLDNTTAPSNGSSNAAVDPERLKKRTERFGAAASTTTTTNSADDEKISKRKERFGVIDEESKKKQRSERFNKI